MVPGVKWSLCYFSAHIAQHQWQRNAKILMINVFDIMIFDICFRKSKDHKIVNAIQKFAFANLMCEPLYTKCLS